MIDFFQLFLTKYLLWPKAFADDKLKDDSNGKCFSRSSGDSVGKGENSVHKYFLYFPQYYRKASFPGFSKPGIVW